MYGYKNIFFRVNTDVEFFVHPPEFDEYVRATYADKLTFGGIEHSEDGSMQIRTIFWNSETDWTEFINDPKCTPLFEARKKYNEAHGIIHIREIITSPS